MFGAQAAEPWCVLHSHSGPGSVLRAPMSPVSLTTPREGSVTLTFQRRKLKLRKRGHLLKVTLKNANN